MAATRGERERLRTVFTALGAPAGVALLVFVVPGPCTSFDGVDATDLCDSAEACHSSDTGDASDAMMRCTATLPLQFDPKDVSVKFCQDFISNNCCGVQGDCIDSSCNEWVGCANRCPPPREGACLADCGRGVPLPIDRLRNCAIEAGFPYAACNWITSPD